MMDIKKKKEEIIRNFEEAKENAIKLEQALEAQKQNMSDARAQYKLLEEMESSKSKTKGKDKK